MSNRTHSHPARWLLVPAWIVALAMVAVGIALGPAIILVLPLLVPSTIGLITGVHMLIDEQDRARATQPRVAPAAALRPAAAAPR